MGEFGFHYIAVTPSSLSGVDAIERKPWAQWSPPAQVERPVIRSALFRGVVRH
jgi:hypothetical protein